MQVQKELEDLIIKLYDVEGVKFGDFKLKSGIQSPAYFDLRVIVSYPQLMREVSQVLWEASSRAEKFESICGVPYTALPIASQGHRNVSPLLSILASHVLDGPIFTRREAKDYGTKKMIEGKYAKGEVCLVVEDVVTTGSSVYETVQLLQEYGLRVKDAVVLLEREQGGTERLRRDGVNLHSVITMTQLISVLKKHKKIDEDMHNRVLKFVAENRFEPPKLPTTVGKCDSPNKKPKADMTYKERVNLCTNHVARQLLEIMQEKQSNLVISLDLTNSCDILQLAEDVGSKVCMVKTHADIIEDFSNTFVKKLQELACKHNFLIFEDRKFADIGNTVQHQYKGGIHHIADWAHIVNAHTVPGAGVVQGLKQIGMEKQRACLLIAEMSSSGTLATGDYTNATVGIANEHRDFVIGFICVKRLSEDQGLLHMTPGVKLETGTDGLGQQYITPRDAVFVNKSDLIIVGRGILSASDPAAEAELFRKAGYDAYLERLA